MYCIIILKPAVAEIEIREACASHIYTAVHSNRQPTHGLDTHNIYTQYT